jgi:hypothetical protein
MPLQDQPHAERGHVFQSHRPTATAASMPTSCAATALEQGAQAAVQSSWPDFGARRLPTGVILATVLDCNSRITLALVPAQRRGLLRRHHRKRENVLIMIGHLLQNLWGFIKSFIFNPSRRWGAAFFLCIPIFALIYAAIPRGFYQSTIKTESAYSDEATAILMHLCDAVATELPEPRRLDDPDVGRIRLGQLTGPWSFTPSTDLHCDRLRTMDDDQIGFRMIVTLQKDPKCPAVITDYCYDILNALLDVTVAPMDVKSVLSEPREFVPPGGAIKFEFAHPVEVRVEKFPPLLPLADKDALGDVVRLLFKDKHVDQDLSIVMDEKFEQEIAQFQLASSGFTSEANGHFLRMLYFSVVTLSTLGYGDIVPVTPLGRAFVTLEVISGLLFAGLFLNSLKAPRQPMAPGGSSS